MADGLFSNGRGRVLLFCVLGWVFDLYDLLLFSFTKGSVGRELGLEPATMSWIEGWSLLATAVGGLLFGRLADRVGRRTAMVWSIVVFSLGAGLTGVAQGYGTLLFARLVTGVGVGGEWGIGHAVVADYWSGRARDRVHGILQAASPLAMMLAAVVGCFVAPLPQVGWRMAFVGSAAFGALALFGRWSMPGPERIGAREQQVAARALLAPPHLRAAAVLFVVLSLHMVGFWCVYAELPNALIALHAVPFAHVGWFFVCVNAVHVFADVLFGRLAARFGRLRTFVAFCLLFAAGQALVLWRLDALQQDFAWFTAAVALMGIGAGTWSCFGALFGEHFPAALRATAAATCYVLARAVVFPVKGNVSAWFHAEGSFAPALWIGIACALLSAAIVLLLPPRRPAGGAGIG